MKMLQINIEGRKHLDTVDDFIVRENPDVVCMQEVVATDFQAFKTKYNMDGIHVPMYVFDTSTCGIALLTKNKIQSSNIEYYLKPTTDAVIQDAQIKPIMSDAHCALLSAEIVNNNQVHNVIVTHFPVHYPGHEVSDFQRECFKKMNIFLKQKKDFILAGDTNSPRGTEIFDTLARDYKDNIPQDAVTTIDEKLHRAGFLPYVVDCMFTTPEYKVTNIKLVNSVSDHLGIVAEIEKK